MDIQKVLKSAEKYLSHFTGYLHLHEKQATRDTISLTYNFAYLLALFKSRQKDSVLQGIELLHRLLSFQTEDGNFPLYLHEYPNSYDPKMALSALLALTQLYKNFSNVIPQKERLACSIEKLFCFCNTKEWKFLEIKKLEALKAFWEGRKATFEAIREKLGDLSSKEIGEYLMYHSLSHEESALIDEAYYLFDSKFGFVGNQENEEFFGKVRAPTLFDLAFSMFDEGNKIYLLQPLFLYGPKPREALCPELKELMIHKSESLTLSYLKDSSSVHLFWKDRSAVIESNLAKSVQLIENKLEVSFSLTEEMEEIIAFYITCDKELDILVDGQKATTFQLGDSLTIKDDNDELRLSFVADQEGAFLGHLRRANRSQQKDKSPFEAYDYALILRAIDKKRATKISLQVEALSKVSMQ